MKQAGSARISSTRHYTHTLRSSAHRLSTVQFTHSGESRVGRRGFAAATLPATILNKCPTASTADSQTLSVL